MINTCKELNAILRAGYLDQGKLVITGLSMEIPASQVRDFAIIGMIRIASADSAGEDVPATIEYLINLWRRGYTTKASYNKSLRAMEKPVETKGKKVPQFSRIEIENELDALFKGDKRIVKIKKLSDEGFAALVEERGNEGILGEAIATLKKQVAEKLEAERQAILAGLDDIEL